MTFIFTNSSNWLNDTLTMQSKMAKKDKKFSLTGSGTGSVKQGHTIEDLLILIRQAGRRPSFKL